MNLFGCGHKNLSRVFSRPTRRTALPYTPHGLYVVCFDCGRQFAYDPEVMRVGPEIKSYEPTRRWQDSISVEVQ